MDKIKKIISIFWFVISQIKFQKKIIYFFLICFLSVFLGLFEGSSYICFFNGIATLANNNHSFNLLHFINLEYSYQKWILIGIGCQFFKSLINLTVNRCTLISTECAQNAIQTKTTKKVLSLPYSVIKTFGSGELTELIRNSMDNIPILINCGYECITNLLITAVLGLALFILSFKLAFITLVVSIIMVFFQKNIQKQVLSISELRASITSSLLSKSIECIKNIQIIHLYALQSNFTATINDKAKHIFRLARKSHGKHLLSRVLLETTGVTLIGITLLVLAALNVSEIHLMLPRLAVFAAISYKILGRLAPINHYLNQIIERLPYIEKSKTFINSDADQESLNAQPDRPIGKFKHEIIFSNVSFRYPHASTDVFNAFSFEISRGSTIAIVGDSGAGKSTFINLLTGLYTPSKGHIEIDGKDITKYCLQSWRSQIAVVSQENAIFNKSIRENILIGNSSATESEFLKVAENAGVSSFAILLRDQYDCILGEGGYKLSGGEKQRIALARALIRSPEILILDEATSHLDTISEKHIQDSIQKLMGKMTIILIAHRLTTVMDADIIYVLRNGRVVEHGTHSSLLAKCGHYATMWHKEGLYKI